MFKASESPFGYLIFVVYVEKIKETPDTRAEHRESEESREVAGSDQEAGLILQYFPVVMGKCLR